MIWIFVLLLLLLLLLNISAAKNWLYPPVIFTAVWLLALSVLAFSQELFYAVSMKTLVVYWVGAVAFSIGGIFSLAITKRSQYVKSGNFRYHRNLNRALNFCLIVVLLVFPFYIARATAEISLLDPLYFVTKRAFDIEVDKPYNPLGNFVILSKFVAMAMYCESGIEARKHWKVWVAVAIAIAYSVLDGAKMGAVMIILTLMFISFMQKGRVNWGVLFRVGLLLICFFLVGLVAVNFAYAGSIDVLTLIHTMIGYWVGPLVAFDTVVVNPASVEAVHKLTRFFIETANSLGAGIPTTSIHAKFANISPTIEGINTYTLYFAYFREYSWPGVIFGMAFLGYILTFVYIRARSKSIVSTLIYGMTMTGLVLCTHGEQFWLSLNPYVKALIFFNIIYLVIPKIRIYAR